MHKVFIQKMKAMTSKTDWIDELDNSEDDQTFFQRLTSAIYKSRNGGSYWWPVLMAMVEDDELTDIESGPMNATDAKNLTSKRCKRDE